MHCIGYDARAEVRFSTMRYPVIRRINLPAGVSVMAIAVSAFAVGALAIGALAIGRIAIKQMALQKAKAADVEIDRLTIHRLKVIEPIQTSQVIK